MKLFWLRVRGFMQRTLWIAVMVCLGSAGVVLAPAPGHADDGASEAPLADEPSVRRKLLYRATRFEIRPSVGMTLGEPYLNNAVTGLNLSYYITNGLGLGVSGSWSPLQWKSSLAKNTESTLEDENPQRLEDLAYSYPQFTASFEFKFVPVFGKFTVMNETDFAYDLHLVAGVSAIKQSSEPATSGGAGGNELSGLEPAGTVGLGFRMFTSDSIAVSLQVRDHLYSTASAGGAVTDRTLQSNFRITAGVSFFAPTTVKISR